MKVFHEFPAYYDEDSQILILGSMPSPKSRQYRFYYMHPQNRFWTVLANVYQEEFPFSIEDKKAFLKKHHIALWDVIASCEIKGAQDASIKEIQVNPIETLLSNSAIKTIYVTGKKAEQLYNQYCYPQTQKKAIYLPSTSAANIANYRLEDLIKQYQKIRKEEEVQ